MNPYPPLAFRPSGTRHEPLAVFAWRRASNGLTSGPLRRAKPYVVNWHRTLLALGLADLDLSGVVGPKRQLTEAIARWAYGHGHASLVYSSRFDAALPCWAIFEGAVFEPVGPPDPTLLSAARDLTVNRSTPEGESAADTRRPPGSIRSCLCKSRLAHEALLL